ncbi:PEP-CTERM sorting domain-containing protein [Motiliproteus sediminis]|uniref:PEP-CTERM sorting domain-containing protein n=1 Tax=Motiliproteus sediminis TaxID=1468178 RepID=UPI001AEFC38F|nr:PEP-CTERM sorting domain-containing protein [Motiliproteus sediminis]
MSLLKSSRTAFRALTTLALMLFGMSLAHATPTYLRSTVAAPWGQSTNEAAMDSVFGAGSWNDFRYETVDTGALFSGTDFIFMEGGDGTANEMEAFITANSASIGSFLNAGGSIFFNAAPNEGNGMNLLPGVDLVYGPGPFCGSDCNATGPHDIFTDLGFGLPGTSFGGTSFSHAIITGAVSSLIEDLSGNTLLGELAVGNGLALFGGMTTTNFHSPQPGAAILRQNILAYAANAVVTAEVPAPATLALALLGLAAVGASRRKQAA